MTAEFSEARNGEITCSYGGKFLHSKYNPKSEAQKFVETIQADFIPLAVIVVEAAMSYCAPMLRQRFPDATLCTIRISRDFSKYDNLWDFVFYSDGSAQNLQDDLYNALGEEKLCSALAIDWQASKNLFPEENAEVWKNLKAAILKSRDVLGTRAYFSKRWLKNSLVFAKNIKNPVLVNTVNLPVIIAASGPSLKTSIPFLKKYRERFVLLAVSSAYAPLHEAGVFPDIVFSTDGGFWAKKHLASPFLNDHKTVFALACEGAVPKQIFENNEIIPLCYDDGIGKTLMEAVGCPYMIAERNGTVSGTTLEFALKLTNSEIFLCGLDQEGCAGFQHTQPNCLELDSAQKDNRLRTKESRCTASQFSSEKTLEIYRNWFVSRAHTAGKRVFRLSDGYNYVHTLGDIKDVDWRFFEKKTDGAKNSSGKVSFSSYEIGTEENNRKERLLKTLEEISGTQYFRNDIFPLETLLIRRELNQSKKEELMKSEEEKLQNLMQKLRSMM